MCTLTKPIKKIDLYESYGLSLRASIADVVKKKKVILTHQKFALLFYHIILQYLIYQMFYYSILYIKIIFTIH